MHMQHSATRHVQAGALMDEVLLRDAQVHCIGHGRDERLCADVAEALYFMGRRPLVQEPTRANQGASTAVARLRATQRRRIAESGRGQLCQSSGSSSDDEDRQDFLGGWMDSFDLQRGLRLRSQKACPELDVAPVLAELRAKFAGNRVEQLPIFQEDARTSSGSRAESVKRAALQSWLGSDAGVAWMSQKRKRSL